jgi:hypothetical protein
MESIITGGAGRRILRPIQILRFLIHDAKKKKLKVFYVSIGVELNILMLLLVDLHL